MENSKWPIKTLTELCNSVTYGYTESASLEKIGPKFLRITDIASGRLNWDSVPYCKIKDVDFEKYKLKAGDIVIARTGATTGANYTFKKGDPDNVVYASYLIKYSINQEIANPYFVGYVLKSNNWSEYVDAIAGGSAQPGANAKQLGCFEIQLPPLPDQKAIASVLSSLDDKIDLLHQQNQTLEALAETLFRQWFIVDAKEDWEEGKLGDEFDFTMGQSPPGDTYNENNEGIPLYQGNADFGFRFPTNRIFTTDPKRFAEKYDTLISVRAPVGAQNMSNERCCIGRGVAAFRYKEDKSYFSYTYYKLASLMNEIKQFNEAGTVFGSISKTDFENIDIVKPPKSIIDKFEIEVKPIDLKIFENSKQIQTLTQLRDTLLPKLMSGDVRVKN